MNYIKVDVDLVAHPKTRKLARLTGLDERETVRALVWVWAWAFKYAPGGDVSQLFADEVLADCVCELTCTSRDSHVNVGSVTGGAFIKAMQQTGFIDNDKKLHDWQNQGSGEYLTSRGKRAEYMRNYRRNSHVTVTSTLRNDNVRLIKEKRIKENKSPLTPLIQGGTDVLKKPNGRKAKRNAQACANNSGVEWPKLWARWASDVFGLRPPLSTRTAELEAICGEHAETMAEVIRRGHLKKWRDDWPEASVVIAAFESARKAVAE